MNKWNQLFRILKKQSTSLCPKGYIVNTVTNFFSTYKFCSDRQTERQTKKPRQMHNAILEVTDCSGRTMDITYFLPAFIQQTDWTLMTAKNTSVQTVCGQNILATAMESVRMFYLLAYKKS